MNMHPKSKEKLFANEAAAERCLELHNSMTYLDDKRQQCQRVKRLLSKQSSKKLIEDIGGTGITGASSSQMPPVTRKESSHWMCVGSVFVKLPTSQAEKLVDRNLKELNDEIDETHRELKEKMADLYDVMERGPRQEVSDQGHRAPGHREVNPVEKFIDLKPLSSKELLSVIRE